MDSPGLAQDGMGRPEHGRTRTYPTFRRVEIVAISLSKVRVNMVEPEKTKPRKTLPAGVVGPEGHRLPIAIERTQLCSERSFEGVEMEHAAIVLELE